MAHQTLRSAYRSLEERLNRFPQGAPPSELLFRILALLFTEEEAALVAKLPIRPFTASRAARRWGVSPARAEAILQRLADKALLLDIEENGTSTYVLPPPMAGFFEFSMMRVHAHLDQRLLAELFYEYLNVEEEFIRDLFTDGETQLGRVFVREDALPAEALLQVLDYERASEVIRSSPRVGIGICYCRHKMEHLGRACDQPRDICMTFNNTAASLIKHGVARGVDTVEALDRLTEARDRGLVQFGENVRQQVNFICHCCGCCCEALLAQKRFGTLHPVHTTNFIAEVDPVRCTGCGKCRAACPIDAIALRDAGDGGDGGSGGSVRDGGGAPGRRLAAVDESICLGCGVCVPACATAGLALAPRPSRVVTPVDSTHRVVLMAIERGKLAELIVDNGALASHRAMAAILGVILRLPPIEQALASRQVRSRYLEALLARRSPAPSA